MVSPALTLVLGCLLAAVGAACAAHGNSAVVGVNVVNPQRLAPGDREILLGELLTNGVRIIRVPLAPPWGGNDHGQAIDFIRCANEHGIKSDLVVELQYREGSQRRPAVKDMPDMWP